MRKYIMVIFAVGLLLTSCKKEEEIRGLIGFNVSTIEVNESSSEAVDFRLILNRVNHDGGTVSISAEGETYGEHYTTSFNSAETTVTIDPGQTVKDFSFTPIDNDIEEEDKTITFEINEVTGDLQEGSRPRLVVTIIDDDAPVISIIDFSRDTLFLDESETANAFLTLTLAPASSEEGSVVIDFGGDAVMGEDYLINGSSGGSLTLDINEGASQEKFVIKTIDNDEMDGDRIIEASFTEPTEFIQLGELSTKVIVIRDDD